MKFEGVKPDGSKFNINPSMFIAKSDSAVINNLGGGKFSLDSMTKNISKVEFSAPGKTGSIILLNKDAEFLRMIVGSKDWEMNGIKNKMDVSPFIKNSRTLVPIRFITESLGGAVAWNGESKEVTLLLDGKEIKMTIGKTLEKYGVAPVIMDSRTYVPVRFVADALGAQTSWNEAEKTVTLVREG